MFVSKVMDQQRFLLVAGCFCLTSLVGLTYYYHGDLALDRISGIGVEKRSNETLRARDDLLRNVTDSSQNVSLTSGSGDDKSSTEGQGVLERSTSGGENITTDHTTTVPSYNQSTITKDGRNASISQLVEWMEQKLRLPNKARRFVVESICPGPSVQACVDSKCTTQLSSNLTTRVHSLLTPPQMFLTDQQHELILSLGAGIPESDLVLITAASPDHYDELQALLHNLHEFVYPSLTDFTMVVWDLGLTTQQRENLQKCCRCHLARFPFEKFPATFRDVRCYMWKPVVHKASLYRARKYLIWQDASIRYKKGGHEFFSQAESLGLQIMRKDWGEPVAHQTLPEMFAYMGQPHCAFNQFPEIMSGVGVYKNEPFIHRAIVEPWARCGMEKNCMCPRDSHRSHYCPKTATNYGHCHRFDQSALSILTGTLYNKEVYRVVIQNWNKYFSVQRNHVEPNYFNSTGCLSN